MKQIRVVLGIGIFIILLVVASFGYRYLKKNYEIDQQNPQVEEKVETEEPESTQEAVIPAEDFSVYQRSGKKVKLSDYFGKPIVLNFWASWCRPCKSEMASFNKVYQEVGDKIQFLMVNMTDGSESMEKAFSYIRRQGFTFPVLYDLKQDAAVTYSVMSLPTTYFIDKLGNIVNYAYGAMSEKQLKEAMKELN